MIQIRRAALHLLARRDHSKKELVRKLLNKKFDLPTIETVLNDLIATGLLKEDHFVENFIHFRRNKGFGPLRIQAELSEKGITPAVIDHYLKINDNSWFDHVRTVWQKRFKNQLPHDFKTRTQHMRFLQLRGFTNDQIQSVFDIDEY